MRARAVARTERSERSADKPESFTVPPGHLGTWHTSLGIKTEFAPESHLNCYCYGPEPSPRARARLRKNGFLPAGWPGHGPAGSLRAARQRRGSRGRRRGRRVSITEASTEERFIAIPYGVGTLQTRNIAMSVTRSAVEI